MASVTHDGVAVERQLEVRRTRDRELLHRFLGQDRIFAAYAIADTDDREFGRTRFGIAVHEDEPVAVVMEYRGASPQPVFAMGEPDGIAAILRDVIRPRVAYLGAKAEAFRGVRQHYRAEAPALAHSSGIGLGLGIARELALQMGGSLECESTPGEGSTFTITLPRAATAVHAA